MSGKAGMKSEKATEVPDRYGEDFLDAMDGRVRTVRTLRQRLSALIADLGGLNNLSYQERSLCKRAIHAERVLERFEGTLARGGSVEFGSYFGLINALSGLYAKLGLKRRAKPVPTLQDYLEARCAAPAHNGDPMGKAAEEPDGQAPSTGEEACAP